jgi:integrase
LEVVSATIDAALRAIERFELSTNRKPFRKFHIEQARSFRARLVEEFGPNGKPLSSATIASTLKHLRNFFLWLSREPGFRSKINGNDANYFSPSDQDMRVATARREKRVATLEEIKRVLALMPAETAIEKRNRALVAFAVLTGARDGALASFRLKHVDMAAQAVFQDGREVRTKGRKTFTTVFFPVGPEPFAIFADYVAMLTGDLGFGPDDPLFPATRIGRGADRAFRVEGLSREAWRSGAPIRQIFRAGFAAAGLRYSNPHTFRDTITRLGQRLCRTPEEWKAWTQNFGHESEATHSMELEKMLRRVHANSANLFHGRSPLSEICNDLILAQSMPSGAVQTIIARTCRAYCKRQRRSRRVSTCS